MDLPSSFSRHFSCLHIDNDYIIEFGGLTTGYGCRLQADKNFPGGEKFAGSSPAAMNRGEQ
jgi:hypothetical protein